ncbi:hypothetical protein QWQ71_004485 [Salmonella enterica]|nr:hypothetical protein [Salmonella enterica]
MSENTAIQVYLSGDAEAIALAQLVKRLSWADCRKMATSDDEAYLMMDGVNHVMDALAEKGFQPR